MSETQRLEAAIAAIEAQRDALGAAVAEVALAPLREQLEQARERARGAEPRLKVASVLFMDIVGSTSLSRRLDPEDIHAVMDGALERLTAVVQAHGGRVLQYAGDSLLAVFGAGEAHEDDAERAVCAGLAILEAARHEAARVAHEFGHDGFGVRVGVHTGPVLLGAGVDAEASIRGITVNVAARMEQTAPPGRLRISQATWRQVRGAFDVEPQPPMEVKGIAEPMRSALVLRARDRGERAGSRGVDGVSTRLIGRDAELARLVDAYEGVREDGRLSQITLVGDAGLGKSRFADEFCRLLQRRDAPPGCWRAAAPPHGQGRPYGLLRELFAARFGLRDDDTQAVAQGRLAQGLAPVFGERADEQTALVGRLIGLDYAASPHIAGIADDARQLRDRAFHAAAEYVRGLLHRDGPLLLVLDDLHWADDGSLDFVNHLCRACVEAPLLLLGLARPTLYERRPLWGSGQDGHERLTLAPLSRHASRELTDALLARLPSVPAALRNLLVGGAEGNPYFTEELVSMLLDEGVIAVEEGRWRLHDERLATVHVPPTLAALLQSRLDTLPSLERETLQRASVVGHVFWDEPLQRLEPRSPQALQALAQRELAHRRETSAFAEACEYVFKHHLLHQVAYDSVLRQPRRELHRLAAEWLLERCGARASEFHAPIADHFERAGDAARAAHHLRLAGVEAARAYANVAALDHLGRALALEADPAIRFELLLARGDVLGHLGRRDEQGADIAALEQLAAALDDDARRAQAGGCRASHAFATGDYAVAAVAAERAVAWAAGAGAPSAALSARMIWGRTLAFRGDAAAALCHIEAALDGARVCGDRKTELLALNQLGMLAFDAGEHGRARERYGQALALARQGGNRAMESALINNLGDLERSLGDFDAALTLLRQGLQVCREIGQRVSEAYLLCNLAWIANARGDPTEALDWAAQAVTQARAIGDPEPEASVLCTEGHARLALHQGEAAATAYERSLALYRQADRGSMQAEPLAGLARVSLRHGRGAEALERVAQIEALLEAGGSVDETEDPAWILLTCHDVLRAAGRPGRHYLDAAHGLLMQRARPLADAERERLLANVPSHRAVMQAWAREGGA